MIPLKDTIPSRKLPLMTWTLIILNIGAFIYQQIIGEELNNFLISTYGLIPVKVIGNIFEGNWRLLLPFVSYTFLHGGWIHLISNVWALWLFGDNVEDRMGKISFVLFYLSMGIIAGLTHLISEPVSPIAVIGASGAIAGVMGAYFVMYPQSKVITLIPVFFIPLFVPIPATIYLGFWFVSQISAAITQHVRMTANIAWWAHVGGFVAGMFLYRFFIKLKRL
ncbi:MAG TPA: rhomboid family intramembrane serine protease [Bacillota bacterium]|jgi:membrane associated rhomboid family serine protease|nr:rhomboid family intramembrane serine protease [Bacillota bacterium]HOL10897.1 rhomboid family intramembrane serine protease [Bacillota bacterium]HPO98781.1 rhomboid family intramembrane serine protease [Bacillota bacterium]